MATRVFELARELGVTSKAVLDKCRAEGIDVKNHMAALSAGLEATICEWFTEGESETAVETAQHVDLDEARKVAKQQRRGRHRKPGDEADAEGEEAETAVVAEQAVAAEETVQTETPAAEWPAPAGVATAVAEAPPVKEAPSAAATAAVAEVPPPAVAEAPQAEPVAEAPAVEVPASAAPEAPPRPEAPMSEGPRVVPNVPERPKDVRPAGPQVVPVPAKLQGPRVVRFVGIEPGTETRRPPVSSGGGRPSTLSSTPGKRPATGATGATDEEGRAKRSKRRSPRRKSGRSAETGEGLREWRDRDLLERSARLAAATGGTLRRHRAAIGHKGVSDSAARLAEVEVAEPISVKDFSAATGIKINEIIRFCMSRGSMATINSPLGREMAEMLAEEIGIQLKIKESKTAEQVLEEEFAERPAGATERRPPVVTFLGHVDHGKTSLLDRIRNARVADGEEGGITQHVGSYRYQDGERAVVFLDTPGHEAFTAMRARGANMTDVVVLVVAADDGVMPQTVEAISHAKAAKVPIVVALNKMDVPNANEQRVLGQLAEHGLHPREWGGQTEIIRTSATTGLGIDDLVEVLSLEAELLELKADPDLPAAGWVIEAKLDPGKGITANVLIKDGTLHLGDMVLAGTAYGRVRSISDDRGQGLSEAGPASPVAITGLDEMPNAGDRIFAVEDLNKARGVAEERRLKQREKHLAAAGPKATLENLFKQIEAGEATEIRLIVKADVQGSLEALLGSLAKLGNEEVGVTVLHSSVGGITEGDVLLAEASEAIILGFRVVADQRARALAERTGIDVRTYMVIYQLLEDVEQVVKGMIAPTYTEKVTGRADVREVFKITRVGTIAGCFVQDGVINRNASVRIVRHNVVVEEGRSLDSLKRFKDDAREVRAGLECGLKIVGFDDVKVGDVIEAYQTVEVPSGA